MSQPTSTDSTTAISNKNEPNQNLTSIYTEMRNRQRKAILNEKQLRADPFFSDPKRLDDDRRCLAISSVLNREVDCEWTPDYWELQRRLKEEFPHHLRFGQIVNVGTSVTTGEEKQSREEAGVIAGQLHWTVMQLVGFPDYEREIQSGCVYTSNDYLDCVQDSLIVGGMDSAVEIRYIGCIAVSTGLLMVGVPTTLDINLARDTLREKLKERNMPLKEPFVNDIVHSTLFRVTSTTDDDSPDLYLKLLQLAKEFEDCHLGTVTLRNFQVGPASWRMLPTELEASPCLRKWTLPDKSPTKEYHHSVAHSKSRNCFTISGASGG